MKKIFLLAQGLFFFCVAFSQTNSFPLYSSGTGPSQLTLNATSGWVLVSHTSADPNNCSVYLYDPNKNVYWGQTGDGGNYLFRGRNVYVTDENFYVTDGNVGIGTSTPSVRLQVNGAIYGNAENHFYLGDGTFVDPHSGQGYAIKIGSGGIAVGGNAVFMNGSVGIGTTAPGPYKMAVEGTLGARKIVVTQANPWSDYVFDEKYKLAPLDSVAHYIKANHHLADIPSADSVAKSGIDLGVNQALLLKKIEELTLYAIGQNDKLKAQAAEIEELKKTVKELSNRK